MEQKVKQNTGAEPMWAHFIHNKGAVKGLPIAGNFELTANCNFRCKMCYVHEDCREGVLSAEEWIAIGKRAVEQGMVFVLLTGGEPFLRPDFKEIYSALIKMGLLISINTNGSLIDDDMFAFLVENPPIRMNISLYAADNEVYKELCGREALEIVKKNIIRLHEAGISVKINSSITPDNASEIEAIYAFGEEHGIPVTASTYMYPPVRINDKKYGSSPARFTAEEAAAYLLKCREQYLTPDQLQNSAALINPDDELCDGETQENMHCRAGKTAFWITWDGRMLPCGMFPDEGYSVRKMGFDAAWEAVKNYTKTIMMPKECTSCPKKDRCSVCAASCISETGSPAIRPDYICRLTMTYDKLLYEKYRPEKSEEQTHEA